MVLLNMGIITYIIASPEPYEQDYMRVEIGRLDDFSMNGHIEGFLQMIADESYACNGVPFERCVVRRTSLLSLPDLEHSYQGPSLTVTDVLTGHDYLQIYSCRGLLHNDNGPAKIYDNGESRHEWGFVQGKPVWDESVASVFQPQLQ